MFHCKIGHTLFIMSRKTWWRNMRIFRHLWSTIEHFWSNMLKKPSNILTLILSKFFEMKTREINSGNVQVLLGYLRHTLYKVSSTLQLLVQSDGPTSYFFWFTFCLHGWDNYNNCKTLLKTSIILLVYLNIILSKE